MDAQKNILNTPVVLLAEDDATFGMLLKFRLEKQGYAVFIATNGEQVLEFIEDLNPDLIICDIMMPFISGLEILERLRRHYKKETPIIMISGDDQEEIKLKADELGANDFLRKPFTIKVLITKVKALLNG